MTSPGLLVAPPGTLKSPPKDLAETVPSPTARRLAWKRHEHGTKLKIDVASRDLGNGYVLCYAVDLPGVHAQAKTLRRALAEFRGVLAEVMTIYRERGEGVPFKPVEREEGDELCVSLEVDA